MKKILLSAVFLCASAGLFAQLAKGNWAITGSVGLNGRSNLTEQTSGGTTVTTYDVKNTSSVFAVALSHFLSEKIEVGVALANLSSTTTQDFHPASGANPTDISTQKTEAPLTAFGLFGNYYFKTSTNFSYYLGAQFGIGMGTGKVTNKQVNGVETSVSTKNNGSTFGLNAGFLYFVRANLAINGNLGLLSYNNVKTESTSGNVTTNTNNGNWVVGVNGVIINIGVKLFLTKGNP